jgi:hypothetical protein
MRSVGEVMAPSDAGTATAGSGGSGLARWLPIAGWLREYDRSWLLQDGIAGITVRALMVPEAMAYAGIAGSPCSTGYTPSRWQSTGLARGNILHIGSFVSIR